MAQRRMFSLKIVDTDAFLDMPQSSQLLYFHLGMRADDDGFISNPKKIMRMIGTQDDDYKVLCTKKFVIPFDSGICVIKHWMIHNLVRSDRYTETQWIREKAKLVVDDKTKKYSLNKGQKDVIPNGNQMEPQVRLGKVRLGKNTSESNSQDIIKIIDSFREWNKTAAKWYGNKTQRDAAKRLIENYGVDLVTQVISVLPQSNKILYVPTITTPLQLEDKWEQLKSAMQKKKLEDIKKVSKVLW